jgi:hypothetical protein
MFSESSLQIVCDVRTNRKQEAAMTPESNDAESHLAEDLAGMIALVVLLVIALYLPLLA